MGVRMIMVVFMVMRVCVLVTVRLGVGMGVLVGHALFMDVVLMLVHIDFLLAAVFRVVSSVILPISTL